MTGRAGLPAFFHLGHRLGRMAAITFLHQPRNGGTTVAFPLDTPDSGRPAGGGPAAYFARGPSVLPRTEATAPVAVAVSSQKVIPIR